MAAAALAVAALAVLVALLFGLACRAADRELKSRAVRLHRLAERIRHYRDELTDRSAEAKLLGEAVDKLTAQASTAQAALTPDAEKPWPRWGYRALREIQTAIPADFRKDNR
ncbi:hypothetical protein AB0A95_31015 [Micromonospora sp. NPDC049230]|uniref:hypothetical protein n=1 Tax=Micromonospora sp. NPDC049230 TaxID=3155502 RepID=UPI0033CF9811